MIVSQANPKVELHGLDCIKGMADKLAPESVHLVVTSIPFEELFTYSGKPEDVGNNGSTIDIRTGRFALNMRFVVEQMYRVLAPGCNACIHIQQLLAYKIQHGFMGRRDFRGAMIDVFTRGGSWEQHLIGEDGTVFPVVMPSLNSAGQGFNFVGEVAIPKNPQAMAQRLNLHSLQFKTGHTRNACNLAPAPNDFVLIFQKPGECKNPVRSVSYKKKNLRGWVTEEEWIHWASGVWADIMEIDILDGARGHREQKHEKHVCALQLEVIRRFVALYTNPIDIQPDVTVLDPFMGIGSTAYVAAGGVSPMTKLKLAEPRNAVGFELKESYHRASLEYVRRAVEAGKEKGKASEKAVAPGLYDEVADEVPAA